MSLTLRKAKALKILDFDIENRPLTYWFGDVTTPEITAIAASWSHQKNVKVWMIPTVSTEQMLSEFVQMYDQADMVTGHYVRRHDLPTINGALLLNGMPPLNEKLVCDTKEDLVKRRGLPASQEALADLLGISLGKPGMSQAMWREANRLTDQGLKYVKERVVGDVRQHKELRLALVEEGMLNTPKVWRP